MKIGAGGLQSLATQELTQRQQAEESRVKPTVREPELRLPEGQKLHGPELNKAVEYLNKIAQMYNHNLKFRVNKDRGRKTLVMLDKNTGETRKIEQEELLPLAERLKGAKGLKLDGYY